MCFRTTGTLWNYVGLPPLTNSPLTRPCRDKNDARAHHLARRKLQEEQRAIAEKTQRMLLRTKRKEARAAREASGLPPEDNDSDPSLSSSESEDSDDLASWGSWDDTDGEGEVGGGGGGVLDPDSLDGFDAEGGAAEKGPEEDGEHTGQCTTRVISPKSCMNLRGPILTFKTHQLS